MAGPRRGEGGGRDLARESKLIRIKGLAGSCYPGEGAEEKGREGWRAAATDLAWRKRDPPSPSASPAARWSSGEEEPRRERYGGKFKARG